MYPFLRGFWTASGITAITLFGLLFLHDIMGVRTLSPDWLHSVLEYIAWAAPFVGLFRIYYRYFIQHRPESHHKSMRRMVGGIIGAAIVLTAAWFILPYCRT